MDEKIKKRLVDFLTSFELVFDHDWDMSRANMADDGQEFFIDPSGTFLKPKVDDESNNWGNRGALLTSYRNLVSKLEKEGIYKSPWK